MMNDNTLYTCLTSILNMIFCTAFGNRGHDGTASQQKRCLNYGNCVLMFLFHTFNSNISIGFVSCFCLIFIGYSRFLIPDCRCVEPSGPDMSRITSLRSDTWSIEGVRTPTTRMRSVRRIFMTGIFE